ncbi:MAG TPA: hypothetical protein DCQ90_05825 [Erysipelotrichaceae bacterium]|nr:hypothetical protein [Erysipelotrichaceae bacterium]
MTDTAMRHLVYESIDIGIHLECKAGIHGIKRRIREIVAYHVEEDQVSMIKIYDIDNPIDPITLDELPKKGGRR